MINEVRFYYGDPKGTGSWDQAASIFAAHDSVNSERTSSLPLVQFWKPMGKGGVINPLADKMLKDCGVSSSDVEQLCFEYPVPVKKGCKGKGKASMTDLMIISKYHAIAMEAKWKECNEEYEPISKWMGNGTSGENRENVLKGWIQYVNDYAGDILKAGRLKGSDIPYQLLHRIASACAIAKQQNKEAVVIYQLFYDNGAYVNNKDAVTDYDVKKFAKEKLCSGFRKLFGDFAGKIFKIPKFYVVMVKTTMEGNSEFAEIIQRAKTEKCDKKKSVFSDIFVLMQQRAANGAVYKFSDISVEKL